MLDKASSRKLEERIEKILEQHKISDQMSYSIQDKRGMYQCVIKYQKDSKWDSFWVSTGYKIERGTQRIAKKAAEEIFDVFRETVENYNLEEKEKLENSKKGKVIDFIDFQNLVELNTTNYNPNKETKADWDFYEYMEYWLYKIIKKTVEPVTFTNYERIVTKRMKNYFTSKEHRKKVKEITADDLDEFYDYLRNENLANSTIDHYNDNISCAYKYLLKKKLVRFNPTELINPITVDVVEVNTYTKSEVTQLLDTLKGDAIELPTLFDSYYGLRRSEIIGLRTSVFDFDNDSFIINHVAIQNNKKGNKEKIYFRDKTKSKKGYRSFPLFPIIKEAVIEKMKKIEESKKIFGNTYNHKYDGYLCVHDNGDLVQPGYFTKRFKKIIDRNNLKKITPHGLRHSIATLLHIEGIDIRDLQDWLGHESITSTNRYTRSDYKKQVATGNVVKALFEKNDKINENKKVKRFIVKKKNIHIAV